MAIKRKKAAKSKAAKKPARKATRKPKAKATRRAAPKKAKKKVAKRRPAAKKARRKAAPTKARTLIVLFNLRRGVKPAAYERWAQKTDVPIAGGLKSVKDFKVFRAEGIFGSKKKPPYKYFEILHVTGLDALVGDIGKEPRMQKVAADFQKYADNPIFIVTEKFAG
jgi:hypothetical protein